MRGFSLIEIIVVLSISLILMVAVIVSFSSFRGESEFNKSVEDILIAIQLARSKTISSENFYQYGVHLETGRITVFKGIVFSENDPENLRTDLSSLIEISDIFLNGGGSDIVFQKVTGKTENYGTITLRIKSSPSKTRTINIKSTGVTDVL